MHAFDLTQMHPFEMTLLSMLVIMNVGMLILMVVLGIRGLVRLLKRSLGTRGPGGTASLRKRSVLTRRSCDNHRSEYNHEYQVLLRCTLSGRTDKPAPARKEGSYHRRRAIEPECGSPHGSDP